MVCISLSPAFTLPLLQRMISRVNHVSVCSHADVCLFLGGSFRDAWTKHKDLDKYEAKWLYVDALMKVVLRGRIDLGLSYKTAD